MRNFLILGTFSSFFRGIPLFIVCVMFGGTQGVVCWLSRIGLSCVFWEFFGERGNGESEEHCGIAD